MHFVCCYVNNSTWRRPDVRAGGPHAGAAAAPDHLSVLGAVSEADRLYFQVHEHAITGMEVTGFCRRLRIDSAVLLPEPGLLPHVICYLPDGPAGAVRRDEASEHGNAQGVD